MALRARLIDVDVPPNPDAVVLVLHGGANRRDSAMVHPTQLSVLRMIPIAHRVARAGSGRLAVFRLLNSRRGWDSKHTPVQDVRWALDELADRLGRRLPTSLVGHSLGGRAAILAGAAPEVRSCVALAAWVYPADGDIDLGGRHVLMVHGSDDRIAKESAALAMAARLRRHARVGFVRVAGGSHSMLRHHALFDGLAAEFAAATLLGTPSGGVIGRVFQGEQLIEV